MFITAEMLTALSASTKGLFNPSAETVAAAKRAREAVTADPAGVSAGAAGARGRQRATPVLQGEVLMPERRLQRTRATLPAGYQFGDARPLTRADVLFGVASVRPEIAGRWDEDLDDWVLLRPRLAPGYKLGDTIQFNASFTVNVIEGEYDTATDPGDEAA